MVVKALKTFQGDIERSKNLGNNCTPYSITSYLIETNNEVILIDTSFPDDFTVMNGAPHLGIGVGNRITSFEEALNKAGYKKEEVSKIIITHNNIDHCGELGLFPNAKIYVSAQDFTCIPNKVKNIQKVIFNDTEYRNFQTSFEISKNIYMLPAFGHTFGHSIVVAYDEDENFHYMFSGDVTLSANHLKNNDYFKFCEDIYAAEQSFENVKKFVKENRTVYLASHDFRAEEILGNKEIIKL